MRKIVAAGLVLTFLLSGCITVFEPVDTPTPPPTPIFTSTVYVPTSEPTQTEIPFAPACGSDPLTEACSTPTVGALSRSCIKKVPYILLGIPPGSTFETLDPGLTCKDEKVRGGVQQYSCSGQQLYSYRVKVCNPGCAAALTADELKCPPGDGFSESGACCWPLPSQDDGCVTHKVDVGGCP